MEVRGCKLDNVEGETGQLSYRFSISETISGKYNRHRSDFSNNFFSAKASQIKARERFLTCFVFAECELMMLKF